MFITTETFQETILGVQVDIHVTIMKNWETFIEFHLIKRNYTFDVNKWSRNGLNLLLHLFLGSYDDVEKYGFIDEDRTPHVTMPQKINIITQASRDIVQCFNRILQKHQQNMIDYAVWYKERPIQMQDYRGYIALITCKNIANKGMLAPGVTYDLIE